MDENTINSEKTSGMAIASLVLGIASLGLFLVPILGFILSVLAIVFGIIALLKFKKSESKKGKGLAIAGLIMGIIGVLISLIVNLAFIGALIYFGAFDDYSINTNDHDDLTINRCEIWPLGQGLECIDNPIVDFKASTISFTFRNQNNYPIKDLTLVSSTTCTGVITNQSEIDTGKTAKFTFTGCKLKLDQRYNEEFTVKYRSINSDQLHSSSGIVSGNVILLNN